MRILIVGAGIGGMTLAALLERRGVRPTLVERAPSFEHAGYNLGLYSLGYRVMHGLGLYERFLAECVSCTHYDVHAGDGHLIKHYDMDMITDRFGAVLSTTRAQLVHALRSSLGEVDLRFHTALENLEQNDNEVSVTFSDGSTGRFDLVVGADGIHSRVRTLVFGEQPIYDIGWGGWMWWADSSKLPEGTFVEYWGAGRFFGAYPTRQGAGVFAAAPAEDGYDQPGAGRRERLRERFAGMGETVDAMLDALPDDAADMFFWRLADVRSAEWTRGRVVLLGDAAAGFLPTAGIGASMAMESAAVLADELSRTDLRFLEHALSLYVKRRKRRVESIQDDSRKLARMMFVKSAPMAAIRNLATRFYSLEALASDIAKAFDEPI